MKRFLLLVCCFFVSIASFCQDIIVTKDAKRIECVISEVSSTEVRYKLWDNQQGPTFVLQTTEISSIIFQNGSVQVFNTPQQTPEQTNPVLTNPFFDIDPLYSVDINEIGEIQKVGNIYTLNCQGTPITIDEAAYVRFIQRNAPEAWRRYYKSVQKIGAGWGLFGSGMLLLTIGIPLPFFESELGDEAWVTGVLFSTLGSAVTIASIPLLSVGYVTKGRNYEYYNETVRAKSQVSLNLQSSKDGIGLALRF